MGKGFDDLNYPYTVFFQNEFESPIDNTTYGSIDAIKGLNPTLASYSISDGYPTSKKTSLLAYKNNKTGEIKRLSADDNMTISEKLNALYKEKDRDNRRYALEKPREIGHLRSADASGFRKYDDIASRIGKKALGSLPFVASLISLMNGSPAEAATDLVYDMDPTGLLVPEDAGISEEDRKIEEPWRYK